MNERGSRVRNHELAMTAYARLAVLSDRKRQGMACARFLLLCGVEACYAGWLDVAERCRTLHMAREPGHRLQQFPSLPDALRDAEFLNIVQRWEHWCSFERAEHLLAALELPTDSDEPTQSRGEWVLRHLQTLSGG